MTPLITISPIADLPALLRQEVLQTSLDYFSTGIYNIEWINEGDWQITVWEDDNWVAVQQIFEINLYVEDQPIPIAGLGNLMTKLERRDCGYGTRAFIAAMAFLHQHFTCDYAMMFCTDKRSRMFEQFGWQIVTAPVSCRQSSGLHVLSQDFYTLVYCLTKTTWPTGAVYLNGLPW